MYVMDIKIFGKIQYIFEQAASLTHPHEANPRLTSPPFPIFGMRTLDGLGRSTKLRVVLGLGEGAHGWVKKIMGRSEKGLCRGLKYLVGL